MAPSYAKGEEQAWRSLDAVPTVPLRIGSQALRLTCDQGNGDEGNARLVVGVGWRYTCRMRAVIQRVSRAEVTVDGNLVGAIGRGYLVFVGVTHTDGREQAEWMAHKIAGLRLFADEQGLTNRSLAEVGGSVLVVSQFTLYADARKGRRPSFTAAAPPEQAEPLIDHLVACLRNQGLPVATGLFRAEMQVSLVNDGPVTIWLER